MPEGRPIPKLGEICRHVRSKNAGPFWIAIDLFFADAGDFARYSDVSAIGAAAIAALFGVDVVQVKRFAVPDLYIVKLSYPRLCRQCSVQSLPRTAGAAASCH